LAKPREREPVAAERDDSHSAEPDSAKPKATRKKTPGETKAASTNSRPKANSEAPKAVEAAPAERTSTRDRQLNKEGTGPKPAAKSPSRRTASTARARPARPDPAETRPTQRESGAASRRSADGDAQHSSTADTTATPAALVAPKFHAPGLDNPAPRYPPLARRRGIEGEVLLKVKVSAEGEPVAVRVVQSSGTALLDRAARNTVAKWHFRPARRGDTAVAASVEVPLAFRLTGG
jgi:protein TonB